MAQALDKERAQWQAERRRREKAREAERRARSEQEKAKAREKAQAEEAIVQCAPCTLGWRGTWTCHAAVRQAQVSIMLC